MEWLVKHKRLGDKPWAVQVEAMRRSEGKAKYAYFLEQGLGKTALSFNDYLNDHDVDLCLVVAPNSFKLDWSNVPELWGRPDVPGWHYPKHPLPFNEEIGVYSFNYECARSDIRHEIRKLMQRRRCMLIIDEATAIKNPDSKTSKGILEFAKLATSVRLLNGTPITQNIVDYYPQLRCVGEFNGWMPLAFRNRFAVYGGYMGKQIIGKRNEDELAEILDRCSFRALKKDWRKDLPPQIVVDPIHVEMTKRQQLHYNEMLENFYTQVNDVDVSANLVLTQYDKLRQLSSGIAIDGDKAQMIEPPESNPKLKAVFDVHEAGPGKTIIVYWYKASGKMLHEASEKLGLHPAWLRGAMQPEDLVTEKRRFNEDPECRVMIAQEDAACRGHDLLGSEGDNRCNKMVFFENSFAYWQRAQMQDRNHRGEQDQQCNIYDIVTSPMDEFAIDVIRKKKDMADAMDELVAMIRSRKFRG